MEGAVGMARGRTGAVLACLVVGAGLLAGCGDDQDGLCEATRTDLGRAEAAPGENRRFDTRGPGWIGGDSAYSVALPDGRTAWLFSDSFVGTVDRWDVPSDDTAMVHNLVLVESEDGTMRTLTSQRDGRPHAFFPDASADEYYWVQDGVVDGDELVVFLARTRQVGEDGFSWVGTATARVSLPDLELVEIGPSSSGTTVAWGAGVLPRREATYVYGVEDVPGEGKFLHLAKGVPGALTDRARWQYWTGTAWSPDESASGRLASGVANEISVSPFEDGYLMVSHRGDGIFSAEIQAWTACAPAGPWEDPTTVYETPETGRGRHFTYNAHGHPELSAEGELLVSYNVNTFDFAELQANPTLYRPRFVTLDLGG